MSQFGDETRIGEHAQRPVFADIDHEGIAGLTGADEGDHTVGTSVGVLHDALIAVEGE